MAGKRYTEGGRLLQNTTIKVRLHPTAEQAVLFDKTFGCCRYLWNRMLADEQAFYAATGEHFIPTPAKYKKAAPFLKEVDSSALATVHQNLRRAFQSFFDRPESYGYPMFKTKKRSKCAYTIYRSNKGTNVYLTDGGIRLPKLGVVKATLHRKPLHWWKLKAATVSKTPSGKYYCSLLFEYAVKEPKSVLPCADKTLGLNYSVPHFYVDSSGGAVNAPHWLGESEKKLAELQRRLSRMEPGSQNYEQQLRKIQELHEHIANQRRDFAHKESRRIANACEAVCVRDADLRAMSQRLRLGNVLDAGFGKFRLCLEYKLERQGKAFIVVDKYFPSAKTCHVCGHIHDALTMKKRRWRCPGCGADLAREVNAAKNLKRQGLAQFYGNQGAKAPA